MLHKYEYTGDYGDTHEAWGLDVVPSILIVVAFFVALTFSLYYSGETNRVEQMNIKWQDHGKEQTQKIDEVKDLYAKLQIRYETAQCQHRGLEVTTVKGITLCMNRDTKALHKIDETAD
jgi:hypothetical protein